MKVAIIGGGAAGFFAALNVKENHPAAQVVIYEKSSNPLSKVKVSGGGRCNVTNACRTLKELCSAYPRGANSLKKAFREFDNHALMRWFEARNLALVTQEDNCVFPRSQNSQTIIDCFLEQAARLQIRIETECAVSGIRPLGEELQLNFRGNKRKPATFAKVIVATGGAPRRTDLAWLEQAGHSIIPPVPSLFSFSMPRETITALMGVVVEQVQVSLQGSGFKSAGPLLITHWGMSGPAILKLSAFGARWLSEQNYRCRLQVNWAAQRNQERVAEQVREALAEQPKKLLSNVNPCSLPERLWRYLLDKAAISNDKKCAELGKTDLNRLLNLLTNDCYEVAGRTSFKEEFVTCGGVSLSDIDIASMQSKACKNLYFAGEVLDIDGITGGFNFQAAWTTAFIAARLR